MFLTTFLERLVWNLPLHEIGDALKELLNTEFGEILVLVEKRLKKGI